MSSELTFNIGIIMSGIAIVGIVIVIIALRLSKLKLQKQLDAEYGKRRY